MGDQLIPLFTGEIQGEQQQLCNARDLHTFLESRRRFADWMKERIEQYGFMEGTDWVVHKFVNNPSGGRPTIDYHLTIDMAKELAMVENNERGRQVRRYFIEMERQARETLSRAFPPANIQISAHRLRLRLLDVLEREHHPEKRLAIHQQLEHASRMLGLPTPDIAAIGYSIAAPTPNEFAGQFWAAIHTLRTAGPEPINHAIIKGYLSINLPQIRRLAQSMQIALPPPADMKRAMQSSTSPRFMGCRVVRSAITGKSVRCWLFDESAGVTLPLM